mmetsp:Transcript_3906/g.13832  ORF Transcript_3906/g.13832 Transcript_3906/m.13832 type:complete len:122 (-) Transcript_3906:32-397(-)
MDEAHRYEPMAQVEPSSVLQERPPEWSHQIRQPEGGLLFRVLNVTILMLSLLVCTLGFTWPLFWVGWTAGVFGLMGAVLNLHMLSSMEVGAAPQRRCVRATPRSSPLLKQREAERKHSQQQ